MLGRLHRLLWVSNAEGWSFGGRQQHDTKCRNTFIILIDKILHNSYNDWINLLWWFAKCCTWIEFLYLKLNKHLFSIHRLLKKQFYNNITYEFHVCGYWIVWDILHKISPRAYSICFEMVHFRGRCRFEIWGVIMIIGVPSEGVDVLCTCPLEVCGVFEDILTWNEIEWTWSRRKWKGSVNI